MSLRIGSWGNFTTKGTKIGPLRDDDLTTKDTKISTKVTKIGPLRDDDWTTSISFSVLAKLGLVQTSRLGDDRRVYCLIISVIRFN
jgi:hypothetical protein